MNFWKWADENPLVLLFCLLIICSCITSFVR